MTDKQAFWTSVNDALDARRDPLEDSSVMSWVGEHPEDAVALARLQRGLSAVAEARPAHADDHPLWIAAAVVLVGTLLVVGSRHRPVTGPAEAVAEAPAAPAPRIHSFRMRVSTASEDGSATVLVDPRGLERRRTLQHEGTTLKLHSTSQHRDQR